MGTDGFLFVQDKKLRWLICTIYLLVCAIQDIRRRKIGIPLSACAGCAALLLNAVSVITGRSSMPFCLGGLLPGALLLVLAFVSRGALGSGDGICFLVLGAFLGAPVTWILLLCALLCAALFGAVLLALHQAGRKTRIPFLPFTAVSWAGIMAVRLSGINW